MKIKKLKNGFILFLVILFSAFLISCGTGGGGGEGDDGTPPDDPPVTPGEAYSVNVTTGSGTIVADGVSQTSIRALVTDEEGNRVADGTEVTFETTAGVIDETIVETDGGIATAKLTSSVNTGNVTISAETNGIWGTAVLTFIPGPPEVVNVTAQPSSLQADGSSTSTIRAEVLDANGNPVDTEILTIRAVAGKFENGGQTITAATLSGVATATYTAPNYVPSSGNDSIIVETTNSKTGNTLITLTGTQITGIALSAEPASLPADGASQSTIRATVTVSGGGSAPDGTVVQFELEEGDEGFITPTATTSGGIAIAMLTSGSSPDTTITIVAEAGGVTTSTTVQYTPGSVTVTAVPNSLLGTGEETSVVTAVLKRADGTPADDGAEVTFTLSDQSLGTIDATALTAGGEGQAVATFHAAAKGGSVTVTATWNYLSSDVIGSEEIEIQAPPAFMAVADGYPDPAAINIKGTGGQSTSQIVFDVRDAQGVLVADGYRIDFEIDSGPNGGEDILPITAKTVNGQVSTVLRSGFKSGPVSIKATYFYDKAISTTTSQIAISAGPPVGEAFNLSAEYLNIAGLTQVLPDGITANAYDVYGNAIPDNTAIFFATYNTGGGFDPGSEVTDGGKATSTLFSDGPSPQEGFVSVTALANNGGRTTHVTSLAINPVDPDIIYAGTDGGGVYKSLDSGASWQNISKSSAIAGQNWIDPYVNDIEIDPENDNIIYAATGYLGQGNLFRSQDGGQTWNNNNVESWYGVLSTKEAILTVLCDDSSNYVWVGTDGLGAFFSDDGESFNSGGTTTVPELTGTGDGDMVNLLLSPTSRDETWTVTYVVPEASATVPVAGGEYSWEKNLGDETMTNVETDSAETVSEVWTVTYVSGLGPVTPDGGNAGNGSIGVIQVGQPSAATETWTLTCIRDSDGATGNLNPTDPGREVFSVESDAATYENAVVGYQYGDYDYFYDRVVSPLIFTISAGDTDFMEGDTFTFTTTSSWQVQGTYSGAQATDAQTDTTYTSDTGGISFTINLAAGAVKPFVGDYFTFVTTIAPMPYWTVAGSKSLLQTNIAYTDITYSSDNFEVSFLIEEGSTPFAEGDKFTFDVNDSGLGLGTTVRDMVKVPGTHGDTAVLYAATNTGVFRSVNGGLLWEETTSFTGDFINTLAIHSDGVIYAGTEDNGVWISTDSGNTWDDDPDGMGRGLNASEPVANPNNSGNGIMSAVTIDPEITVTETWTVTCIDEGDVEVSGDETFSVVGTVSGTQATDAQTGTAYTSGTGGVSFTISAGTIPFEVGDNYTFITTRDLGKNIRDLLVDDAHGLLYAVTYFWGALEPHAVGNAYVHDLEADGSFAATDWREANVGLPEYDPPDDVTLFAQHAMAGDFTSTPNALYIGGEGINLYKATSAVDTGNPAWHESKIGMTNVIMARMPILFSGGCYMTITEEFDPLTNIGIYTVYVEDSNGNPPVVGSELVVEREDFQGNRSQIFIYPYDDSLTNLGTWRDPADPETNRPFIIPIRVSPWGEKIIFTFRPTDAWPDAPGTSGGEQVVTYTYY
jgi:hypothetical protein